MIFLGVRDTTGELIFGLEEGDVMAFQYPNASIDGIEVPSTVKAILAVNSEEGE